MIAVSGANLIAGAVAAERVREAVSTLKVVDSHQEAIPVTVSIGLAVWRAGELIDALMDRVDRAMYRAKAEGRNRVKLEDEMSRIELLPAASAG